MWRSVLVYCGILTAVSVAKINPPVTKCIRHDAPLPLDVEVEGCSDRRPPCVLAQGDVAHISVAFRAPRYMATIETRMSIYQSFLGVIYEMPIELENQGRHTCKFLWDAKCPVRKGEIVMFPIDWNVYEPTFHPGDAAAVEIGNMDDKALVSCLRIEFIVGPEKNNPFAFKNRRSKNLLISQLYLGE